MFMVWRVTGVTDAQRPMSLKRRRKVLRNWRRRRRRRCSRAPLPLVLLLTLVTFGRTWFRVFRLLLLRLVRLSFSFSRKIRERAARRRTRSGRVLPFLMWLLLLPSWTRGETTMTSRRDRVVRAGTAPRATMSDHWSWRVFTWVSVSEGNSFTMCVTISPKRTKDIRAMSGSVEPCSTASDLTDRDRGTECSWSERLPLWPMPNGLPVWPMPEDRCPECRGWVRLGDSSAQTFGLSEFVKSWKTWECSGKCSICKEGMLPSGSRTLCSNCTDLSGELRIRSSDWARHWSAFSNWAFWPVWTGLTDSPGVTDEPGVIGVPGVVTAPSLPGVISGTEHRVPGTGSRIPVIGPVLGFTGCRCDRNMFRVHWSVDWWLLNRPGETGVVAASGLPGVVGETEHRVPGPSTGYRSLDWNRVPMWLVHVQSTLVCWPMTAEPTLS